MTVFKVSPDNTFGFLTRIIDIHFGTGPTGQTGPQPPSYQSWWVYPAVQAGLGGVSKGFETFPDGTGVFLGFSLVETGPRSGFTSLNNALSEGFAFGPFTEQYAATFAALMNTINSGIAEQISTFTATSSGRGQPYLPAGESYYPGIVVPPGNTVSPWAPGSFVNYPPGDAAFSFIVGQDPGPVVTEGTGINTPTGPFPIYSVGGPTLYQGKPPYGGN